MIEVPSAALIAEQLAAEVDFFSLGTNDLVQYTLAVDRGTARVAGLYEPLHPAVLRLIHQVVVGARAAAIPTSVCGQMAADPMAALVLMGLGVRLLSVSPSQIPEVREVVRAAHMGQLEALAHECLTLATGQAVRGRVGEAMAPVLAAARPPREEGAP